MRGRYRKEKVQIETNRRGERADGSERGLLVERHRHFSVCRVSHPALTVGYAHSEDGCLPIDQLEPARQLVPKKRGLTHPPSDHPVRNVTEEWFYLFLLFFFLNFNPSVPPTFSLTYLLSACSATQCPNREKKFFPLPDTSHPCTSLPSDSPFSFHQLPTFFSRHENSTRETQASFPVVQSQSRCNNRCKINKVYKFISIRFDLLEEN